MSEAAVITGGPLTAIRRPQVPCSSSTMRPRFANLCRLCWKWKASQSRPRSPAKTASRKWPIRPFDLVLLDLTLPGRDGMDILSEIRSHDSRLPVIMITAYGTVENAVRAMQSGAANFVQKPWDNEKLLADVRAAVGWRRAEEENVQLKRALKQRYNFENIVGKSEPMLKIFDLVAQVANSRSTVLLQGESGTGKEVIAKAIHLNSPRRDKPFVPVNTGSMPTDLLESTLFGHVKGAFTSAIASKKGLFEVADKGTLFLDEIATMGLETQAKILRVCCKTAGLCIWAEFPRFR